MDRRDFLVVFAGAVSPLPFGAKAAERVTRIGLISTAFGQRTDGIQALKDRLRALGYAEGRNLVVEIRDGEGRNERLTAFAKDLAAIPVDAIVPIGPYAIQVAKETTSSIPIVFTGIGANFGLARSEGNLTGVAEELIESTGTRLVLLKQAIPGLTRIGIIANPNNYGTQAYLQQCRSWAEGTRASLHVYHMRDPDDVSSIFNRMLNDRVEAIVAFPDSVIFSQRDAIVRSALKSKLPGVYIYREWVAAGGLMAYGANQTTVLGTAVPALIDKILNGAKPSDLPVQPARLELFLNRRVATAMGITFPPSLLDRAAEILE